MSLIRCTHTIKVMGNLGLMFVMVSLNPVRGNMWKLLQSYPTRPVLLNGTEITLRHLKRPFCI